MGSKENWLLTVSLNRLCKTTASGAKSTNKYRLKTFHMGDCSGSQAGRYVQSDIPKST